MSGSRSIPSRAQRLAIAAAASGTHDQWYARIKMKTDPAYDAVIGEVAGSGLPLLDIGCGMGLLGHYLCAAGFHHPVIGLDFDPRKILQGQRMAGALGNPNVHLSTGNALTDLPDFSGTVVILDILQYFDRAQRQQVLEAAAARVSPGGKLIIRSGLMDSSWRFKLTAWMDKLAAVIRWMKTQPQTYPSAQDFESMLSQLGFTVSIRPLWGRTPFNNYLIVATRVAAADASSSRAPSAA